MLSFINSESVINHSVLFLRRQPVWDLREDPLRQAGVAATRGDDCQGPGQEAACAGDEDDVEDGDHADDGDNDYDGGDDRQGPIPEIARAGRSLGKKCRKFSIFKSISVQHSEV